MTFIRLYLIALTIAFFIAVAMKTSIGLLEGTVITCVPLLLIFDMREELGSVALLEKQLANLTR